MRFLFSTLPLTGHLHPLVPLAKAVERAGHEVAFTSGPSFCAKIEAAGFRAFPAGIEWPTAAQSDALFPHRHGLSPTGRVRHAQENLFAGLFLISRVPALMEIIERWRPAVVVRENCEFACCLAAERLETPHATVQIESHLIARRLRQDVMSLRLNTCRLQHDLPLDPTMEMPDRYLHLAFVPPSLCDPECPLPRTAHLLRPEHFDRSGEEELPGWIKSLPDRPTVYATLGTVVNHRVDLFAAILRAFQEMPVNLILTVGRDQDPTQFGPQPAHIHVERYVPQSLLLPHCVAVVAHGGLNSVKSVIEHGLPMVLVPIGADQPENAGRCAALGVARVLSPESASPDAIRDATRLVLEDESYRRRAQQLRVEFLEQPGLDYAVSLLEQLAKERRPMTRIA